MKLSFDCTFPKFEEVSERGHQRAHKHAGTMVAMWFLRERVKHRFDGSMKDELFWVQRDEKYERHKRMRGIGAGKPHFYTGSTASKFRKAVPRVTKKFVGIRATGLGPQYNRFDSSYSKNKGGRQVMKLRQEIARLSNPEGAMEAKIYVENYIDAMQEEIWLAQQQVVIK